MREDNKLLEENGLKLTNGFLEISDPKKLPKIRYRKKSKDYVIRTSVTTQVGRNLNELFQNEQIKKLKHVFKLSNETLSQARRFTNKNKLTRNNLTLTPTRYNYQKINQTPDVNILEHNWNVSLRVKPNWDNFERTDKALARLGLRPKRTNKERLEFFQTNTKR